MKIFYWVADYSGCGYYRCLLPGSELAKRGHDVMADGRVVPDEAKNGECDVIVGQRVCTEGASHTWQKLARTAGGTKLVFETDDDLLSVDPSNKAARRFYDEGMRRRYVENMAVADLVTTTTEALAERCAEINPNVVVLPNQVPAWLLEHSPNSATKTAFRSRLTIGWRGGTSHARDFGELARPLRQFLQHPKYRDRAEFHAMGAPYHERVATRHGRVRWTGWHEGVADFLRAVDFDLAVIPLRPTPVNDLHSTPFNEYKSDLALVEMAALGIPAIVSSTGPYIRTVLDDGAPACLATDGSDWARLLRDLVDDTEFREQLGKQAREWAASRTIEGNVWRWEEAYSS